MRIALRAAGATGAEAGHALAQAKAHPDYFEPVFTVSGARFAQLKAARGPASVYAVPGTSLSARLTWRRSPPQLGAQVVGSLGPITAQQLHVLGAPYDSTAVVGQTGLEASQQRTLAGTPMTRDDVQDAGGHPVTRLAAFPGHPGEAVRTSLDPRVQRAAEAALSTSTRPNVAMVALRASTGQEPAARFYGLQRTPRMGLPAFAASVPRPASRTELAADAMGQGRLTFSPLGMATVAASIDSGAVRALRLVAGAPDDRLPASRLPGRIVKDLRGMMAGVVTSGTAAGLGLPPAPTRRPAARSTAPGRSRG